MFNKIVYTLKPQGASLWGVRLAVGWLGVTVVGLAFDLLVGNCNLTRCDLFITLFTTAPGIPLSMACWMLLQVIFGHIEIGMALGSFLFHIATLVTLYVFGAIAERMYYK